MLVKLSIKTTIVIETTTLLGQFNHIVFDSVAY